MQAQNDKQMTFISKIKSVSGRFNEHVISRIIGIEMPFKENMYAQETASREEYTFQIHKG